VLLFAPAVALGIVTFLPMPHDPWTFATRRHLDAVLPFLAVWLVVGVVALWCDAARLWERRVPLSSPRRPTWALGVVGAVLLALAVPTLSLLSLWSHLPREYGAATQVASEGDFAVARFVRDNLPEGTLIAATEPGAIRYVSRR